MPLWKTVGLTHRPCAVCSHANCRRQGFASFRWTALPGHAHALGFWYQASSDVNGGTVTIGYPYSMLEWCAEAHSSWSLPLDVRRIPSQKTAQEVGAEQVQVLAELRAACTEALDIVLADGWLFEAG